MRRKAKAPFERQMSAIDTRPRARPILLALAVLASFACGASTASLASAATVLTHPYIDSFDGSAALGAPFTQASAIAVDATTGSVYVLDGLGNRIVKFDQAGNPDDFSALGTPILDGSNTTSGSFNFGISDQSGIAVDNSGGPLDGTIYVASQAANTVYVFDRSGAFRFQQPPSTSGNLGPSAASVDGDGNLYLGESTSTGTFGAPDGKNGSFYKFQPSLTELTFLQQRSLFDPTRSHRARAIANDSGGNLYVVQAPIDDFSVVPGEVAKFSPSGAFLSVFSQESASGIAVDPSSDHVFLARQGLGMIEYDEFGTPISEFGTTTVYPEVGYSNWLGIALDPSNGRIFVADSIENEVHVFGALSPVTVADATIGLPSGVGFFGATLNGTVDPLGIATAWRFEYRRQGSGTWTSTPIQDAGSTPGSVPVSMDINGLQHDTTYQVRLVTVNTELDAINRTSARTFTTAAVPTPTINPPSAVTATSAHLSGSVNPQGLPTTWRFEYSADRVDWGKVPIPDGDAGSGNANVDVEVDATGLEPNMHYFVRLVAINDGSEAISAEQSFTTDPLPPIVEPRSAFPVTDTSATLRGLIDPNNTATTYYFEYGSDTAYGSRVPIGSEDSAGQGGRLIPVQQTISGLEPESTYHFRLIADSPVGTPVVGPDVEFSTTSSAEAAWPGRSVELVTPPDKADQRPIDPRLAPSGDQAVWATLTGAPGSPTGNGGSFVSERGPAGWTSKTLLPSADQLVGNGQYFYQLLAATPDFSSRLFKVAVSPMIAQESDTTYVRVGADGSQEILGKVDFQYVSEGGEDSAAVSPDLEHVYISTFQPFDPEHPGGTSQLYDLGTGSPEIVSRLDDGSVPACGVRTGQFSGFSSHLYRPSSIASDPGAPPRLVFGTAGNECGGPEHLYRHDAASGQTVRLTGAPLDGEASDEFFVKGTPDLSEVIFVTRTNLDPDDSGTGLDVYRWSESSDLSCLSCVGSMETDIAANVSLGSYSTNVVASRDLSHVYFTSYAPLVTGQPTSDGDGGVYLYMWHEDELTYITRIHGPLVEQFVNREAESGSMVTPDGNTLVFNTKQPGVTPDLSSAKCVTTANLPEGCLQYYRYTASSGALECITCDVAGQKFAQPQKELFGFSPDTVFEQYYWARSLSNSALTDDGRTFVFTSDRAYIASDVNRSRDIYEWRDGRFRLITDGVSEYSSNPDDDGNAPRIVAISGDGRDLMFTLGARLTGHEIENAAQLYDARIGGGFPPPPEPPAPCIEDACQGPLDPSPPLDPSGTSSLTGPGNSSSPRQRGVGDRCQRLRRRGVAARREANSLEARARDASGDRARELGQAAKAQRRRAIELQRKSRECEGASRRQKQQKTTARPKG